MLIVTIANWPERSNADYNLYLPYGLPPTSEREVVYLFKAMAGSYFGFPRSTSKTGSRIVLPAKAKNGSGSNLNLNQKTFAFMVTTPPNVIGSFAGGTLGEKRRRLT